MRTMSKLMKRTMVPVLAAFLLLGFSPVTAREGESQVQIQKLVTTENGTEAKEEPRDSAKTAMTYEPGSQIAIVGEENADWYKVVYQGSIYYVKQSDTIEFDAGYAQEELDQQFEQEKIESKILVEEIERQQKEARQTRIWVAVIVVLVLAIFGVGIYSNLAAKKAEKKNNDEDE